MFTEHQLIIGEQQSDVVLPEYLQLWKHLYQNLYIIIVILWESTSCRLEAYRSC